MEGIDEMWMRSEPCWPDKVSPNTATLRVFGEAVLLCTLEGARRRARRRSRFPSCGRPELDPYLGCLVFSHPALSMPALTASFAPEGIAVYILNRTIRP